MTNDLGLRKLRDLAAIAVLMMGPAVNGRAALGANYLFSKIEVPGAVETSAYGISNDGRYLVGSFVDAQGQEHGFRQFQGQWTTLDFPAATATVALGVNNAGTLVGGYFDDAANPRPFFASGHNLAYHGIEFGEGFLGMASGINDGTVIPASIPQVVGYVTKDGGAESGFVVGLEGTGHTAGKFFQTKLGGVASPTVFADMNVAGDIVGDYVGSDGMHRGLLRLAGGSEVNFEWPLGASTQLTGIDDRGVMIGSFIAPRATPTTMGFVFDDYRLTTLEYPGAEVTIPSSISNDGLIVGFSQHNGRRFGFLATPVDSLVGDLNGDLTVDLTDFGILKANFGSGTTRAQGDVNGDAKVDLTDFGLLKDNFGKSGTASVPEPTTFLLALLGLAVLAAVHRKSVRQNRS